MGVHLDGHLRAVRPCKWQYKCITCDFMVAGCIVGHMGVSALMAGSKAWCAPSPRGVAWALAFHLQALGRMAMASAVHGVSNHGWLHGLARPELVWPGGMPATWQHVACDDAILSLKWHHHRQ